MVGMVADHRHDLGREFSGPPAAQQIGETVHLFGRQDRHARPFVRQPHRRPFSEPLGDRRERPRDAVVIGWPVRDCELDPLKEDSFLAVGVLFGVHDRAVHIEHELRDGMNKAGTVRAGDQQDCGDVVRHAHLRMRLMINMTSSRPTPPATA